MKERKLGLLGKKIGMTRMFNDKGQAMGVTILELGPCTILRKRSTAQHAKNKTDGYTALQVGFAAKKQKKLNKADTGTFKTLGVEKAREFVRELRTNPETAAKYEAGADLTLKDLGLKIGDLIDVTGQSKGKGFQGVFRRYGFKGHNATHGTHEYFRHPGSIGCRKWPGRVFKGRRLPGHMGDRKVTTQNIQVVGIREEENLIFVEGSIPGSKNSYILVRPAIKSNPTA